MRIRRTMTGFIVTLLAILSLAGPASAGGRPQPPADWVPIAIMVGLLVVGALFVSVIAFGIAGRRRHQ
jgi:hypothetical protein